MDIKLKNKLNKYMSNFLIIILIFGTAIGLVSSYKFIKKEASIREQKNIFETYYFANEINKASYSIYFDILNEISGGNKRPSEILVDSEKLYEKYGKDEEQSVREHIDNEVYNHSDYIKNDLKNLEYYAESNDKKVIRKRSGNNLEELTKESPKQETLKELNNKYKFYIVFKYDDKGGIAFEKLHGAKEDTLINEGFYKAGANNIWSGDGEEITPVKNITVVYGVLKNMQYRDNITNYIESNTENMYRSISFKYITVALFFIFLCALIIPYKCSSKLFAFNTFKRAPLEIVIALLGGIIWLGVISPYMIYETIDGSLKDMLSDIFMNNTLTNISLISVNILVLFLVLFATFMIVILVKYVFKVGVKNYFKEKSLICRFFIKINGGRKKVLQNLKSIDLKEKNTKKILILLGINFVVLTIISSIWFFGIIVSIVYTVFLYYFINKYVLKVRKDYNKLLTITEGISHGNLEVDMTEDMGIFTSIQDELANIQKGFKRAVDEEVKSQKMKTELISNVSHDLKTPLTSIITYVDLLKNQDISEVDRKLYIDTIERKSQRLKYLIEDLFEVTKASSGNMTLNIDEVDIVSLIKETLIELDDKIKVSELKIKTNFPEEKVILPLDSQRTFRIFDNLISNITKYAMSNSRVYIDIFQDDINVMITLKNISADEIDFNVEDIVERFQRGDKARNTEGSGLGLAIAKSFVELQGGTFKIEVDGDLFKVIINFNK